MIVRRVPALGEDMVGHVQSAAVLLRQVCQRIAFALIIAFALGAAGYTLCAAAGLAPWASLVVAFDGAAHDAGPYLQVGVALLALCLCFFLPANARIMALETSHRSFQMGMSDVARAYAVAHASDRAGQFRLKGEFDSIRERIAFLRDHPDLAELEPSVLELAAQMSHVSAELAQVYSDANVARARDFLIARQQEVETFNDRIDKAKGIAGEMRQWIARVEMEEAMARSQLARLRDELHDLLTDVDLPQTPPDAPMPAGAVADASTQTPENVTRLEPRAAE